MRITVNLSQFFTDHRKKAKIYVSDNIKYIKDLQKRISKVFEIDNFYLKGEDDYLPPGEDIRLLHSDDTVWAIPISIENRVTGDPVQDITVGNSVQVQEATENHSKKKKKKKSAKGTSNDEITSRKKRKRETNQGSSEVEIEKNLEECETNKVEENAASYNKADESLFKDSGRDSLESSKSEDLSSEGMNVNVKSLVDAFENKKFDFKSQLKELQKHSTAADIQRRVNIVKTIIVHDSTASTSTNNNLIEFALPSAPNNPESNVELPKNITLSNIEQDTTLDNSYCSSSTLESGDIKKQKRKRVRKRKRANKNPNSPSSTFKISANNLIPRPLLTKSCNPRHVRFEDDLNEQEDASIAVVNDTTNNCEVQEPEEIVIDESNDKNIPKTVVENEKLTESFILKQPVMENMHPRCGDIVAFKILRISESYTPEISSRIVGKIINYNPQNSEVTFDIIYGQDQCVQPQGKFSLTSEEEIEETNNNKYKSTWPNLLEPRLLFP